MPVRVIFQRADAAELLVDNVSKYVAISKGLVMYVSFLKESRLEDLDKVVDQILGAKLLDASHFESAPEQANSNKSISLSEALSMVLKQRQQQQQQQSAKTCDILVVPQASIGGKLKGKMFQYHPLVDKQLGEQLYHGFVRTIARKMNQLAAAEFKQLQQQNGSNGSSSSNNNNEEEAVAGLLDEDDISKANNMFDIKCGKLCFGTYGNRQALKLSSSGPYTHMFDF